MTIVGFALMVSNTDDIVANITAFLRTEVTQQDSENKEQTQQQHEFTQHVLKTKKFFPLCYL